MAYPDGSAVQWMQYSQKAFDKAKVELKPVFLVISAPWCHWCREYEQSTLESEEISRNLNRHLVPVFVDGERRPDVARRYFSGGTPTTVIFDFAGEELMRFSGHLNKNSLMAVLERAASGKIERRRPEKPLDERRPQKWGSEAAGKFLAEFDSHLVFIYDELYGGFGKGEKFPFTYVLDYLAVQHMLKGKKIWRNIVEKSLSGISRLQDGVEGGFFRYADSREWEGPHYEKTLSGNSAIADVFLKAGKVLGNPEYSKIGKSGLEWMETHLQDGSSGGFFGSQAADSHYFQATADARKRLAPPNIDRTKYTDSNAQAILAFLHSYKLQSDLGHWEVADRALDFMLKGLVGDGGVMHCFDGKEGPYLDGQMLDNAWAAIALLEAYRIGKQEAHLEAGVRLVENMIACFFNPEKKSFIERAGRSLGDYRTGEERSERILYKENAFACWALIAAFIVTKNKKYATLCMDTAANFLYVNDDLDSSAIFAQIASNLSGGPT
ncbi:MAG TPA: DUF255 domain-containing protein [Candidatus Norongarragalinales archaeon]|nr:DUF255 domain-containing protein [Candidatus Norongarragalinales archaeon]